MTSPLDAAARVGRSLCESTHWDRAGHRCNWMGRPSAEADHVDGPITPTSAALGPDLYAGSSGVALFLAELSAQTGDPLARRTALGALARSVHGLDGRPGTASPLSVFDGHLGVAYAAHRIAALTDDAPAHEAADILLARALNATASPRPLDVIGGDAGAIPALLALGRDRAPRRCRDAAIALGEELLRTASDRGPTWTWAPEIASGPGPAGTFPAGIAHGASGFGLALLELHAVTGRDDFRAAALGAFAHADSRADRPDPRRRPPSWCRGAPGIALARLRAAAIDPPGRASHLASARLALDATLSAIDALGPDSRADASLCHGLSGALEALALAGSPHAEALAHDLIARHSATGDWPTGVPSGGPNPSLMLGTAGIGHALLRLHAPLAVPPILILTPAEIPQT